MSKVALIRADLEHNKLLVDHPEAMSPVRRGTEWSITLFGWLVWVFLCRPAMMAVLWIFGVELFYEHMVRLGGLGALFDFTIFSSIEIVGIYIALRAWNVYNSRRFKGKEKRKTEKIVDKEDLEKFFHLPAHCLGAVQEAERLDVHFPRSQRFRMNVGSTQDASPEGTFKST